MKLYDIIMLSGAIIACLGGIAAGVTAKRSTFGLLRNLAVIAITCFIGALLAALPAGRAEPDLPRVVIFWVVVASSELCGVCFIAGIVGVFRRGVRGIATVTALIPLLTIPVFFVVTALSRAMR
jgi:hypothetical protein